MLIKIYGFDDKFFPLLCYGRILNTAAQMME